jgi:hypothetical protein
MLLSAQVCSYTLDHILAEPSQKFKRSRVGQVWWSTSVKCKDVNIVVSKASLGASHPILDYYILINIFMVRMIMH